MTDTRKTNGKLPATVITGFLGAGKTSMIRHLLETANGKRLALIINEFGDLGVDGEILKSCGIEGCREDDVIELANGCICCTVADDFVPVMEALLDRDQPPDHIVIETSGLALPKPLIKAFNWPEIRTRVTVDGVIAVIDGEAVAAGRDIDAEAAALVAALPALAGPAVLVANEVGLGIVPENALARRFRDAAGRLNQAVAAVAQSVVFMAAGLPMQLKSPS